MFFFFFCRCLLLKSTVLRKHQFRVGEVNVNPQEGDWPAQEGKSAQGLILRHSRPRFLPILLGQGRGHQRRTPVHITLESVSALLVGWVAPWVEPWTWV